MHYPVWTPHTLHAADSEIAWYDAGNGPPVLFIHGGAGHDHGLMRDLAAPLTATYRCILYDQRGSGGSVLPVKNHTTLNLLRFIEDIDTLRDHLGVSQLTIVGWSFSPFSFPLPFSVPQDPLEKAENLEKVENALKNCLKRVLGNL